MKTPTKLITALALAGLAVAGGAAFTAGGVTNSGSMDASSTFIGGSAPALTMVGAVVNDVAYTYVGDNPDSGVATIVVTFAGPLPVGNDASIAVTSTGTNGGTSPTWPATQSDRTTWTFTYTGGTPLGYVKLNTLTVSVS